MLSFGNSIRCKLATRWQAIIGLLVASVVAGCGGGGTSAQAPPEKEPAAKKTVSKPKDKSDSTDDATVASKSRSSGGVRKSSRGIPYDAFFDNPLGEANNAAVIPGATAVTQTTPGAGESTAKPMPDSPKPAAGGSGIAWADFISIDVLQEEVKKVRNHLTSAMQGQGSFNKECKDIGWEAALLAGLAGIAIDHSEAASWKSNAHYIREFSTELSNAAVGPGKEYFEKSKTAYEKLAAVFGGSVPADAGDVPAKRKFEESADRGGVMKRIEKGSEYLKKNINNEAKLKSEKETILYEAALIAALGKVIATEGYAGTDEEEYQKYATNLIDGAKEATAAANDQSYEKFTEANNKIGKSCTECHPKYAT